MHNSLTWSVSYSTTHLRLWVCGSWAGFATRKRPKRPCTQTRRESPNRNAAETPSFDRWSPWTRHFWKAVERNRALAHFDRLSKLNEKPAHRKNTDEQDGPALPHVEHARFEPPFCRSLKSPVTQITPRNVTIYSIPPATKNISYNVTKIQFEFQYCTNETQKSHHKSVPSLTPKMKKIGSMHVQFFRNNERVVWTIWN